MGVKNIAKTMRGILKNRINDDNALCLGTGRFLNVHKTP